MKKLLFILSFIFSLSSYSQTNSATFSVDMSLYGSNFSTVDFFRGGVSYPMTNISGNIFSYTTYVPIFQATNYTYKFMVDGVAEEFIGNEYCITITSTDTQRVINLITDTPSVVCWQSCEQCIIYGCTDSTSSNFNINATIDDGSCTISQSNCSNLFISEYVEGPGQNNAIEIYNPTNSVIDLSGYTINRYGNGSITASGADIFALSGSVGAGDAFVIGNGQLDSIDLGSYWSVPVDPNFYALLDDHCSGNYSNNSTFYFNGDDAMTLEYQGVIVDIFGKVGEDPGSAWTDDVTAGYTDANGGAWWTKRQTLIRKTNVKKGVTQNPIFFNPTLEYDSLPDATYSNLGSHICDCFTAILGCTDPLAFNYDSLADSDDGSCIYCDISFNTPTYQSSSSNTVCDGYIITNATSSYSPITYSWSNGVSGANNLNLCTGIYTVTATDAIGCSITDTFTIGQIIYGCMDPLVSNYNSQANIDDSSCCFDGCTDSTAFNYNSLATCDDSSCVAVVNGCTDVSASNYDAIANIDNGSCYYCDVNITTTALQDPTTGLCNGLIMVNATSSYSSVSYSWNTGSTNNILTSLCAGIYELTATDSLGCIATQTYILGNVITGCMDSTAVNYNPNATTDDGSCIASVFGCTDPLASNYDSLANTDNGTCTTPGCTPLSSPGMLPDTQIGLANSVVGQSYNQYISIFPEVNVNVDILGNSVNVTTDYIIIDSIVGLPSNFTWNCVSSCNIPAGISNCFNIYSILNPTNLDIGVYPITIHTTSFYSNVLFLGTWQENNIISGYSIEIIGISGCTDPLASNYDPNANTDDGSCTYSTVCTEPIPTGLFTSNIVHNRATINWDNMNDANCTVDQYRIKYREVGTNSWSQKNICTPLGSCTWACNKTDKLILGLNPGTTYEYQIRAWYCGAGNSAWSSLNTFTTLDACP
ncbi:lamin tail domain-containing protein, partial [Flavobacteriales bacterium]|nr:lamin tail domain-containing protein [Flavobacteriales bacterium]